MKFKKVNGFEELSKAIAEAVEAEKKSRMISAEMATATVEFTNAIVNIADKYDVSRLDLMQTTVISMFHSCFDIDWDSYDPNTGMCKAVK